MSETVSLLPQALTSPRGSQTIKQRAPYVREGVGAGKGEGLQGCSEQSGFHIHGFSGSFADSRGFQM